MVSQFFDNPQGGQLPSEFPFFFCNIYDLRGASGSYAWSLNFGLIVALQR